MFGRPEKEPSMSPLYNNLVTICMLSHERSVLMSELIYSIQWITLTVECKDKYTSWINKIITNMHLLLLKNLPDWNPWVHEFTFKLSSRFLLFKGWVTGWITKNPLSVVLWTLQITGWTWCPLSNRRMLKVSIIKCTRELTIKVTWGECDSTVAFQVLMNFPSASFHITQQTHMLTMNQ